MKKQLLTFTVLFASIFSYSQTGLHPFFENGHYGYLKSTIEDAITPQFTYAADFSDGLALVAKEGSYMNSQKGYINEEGKWVIEPKYLIAGDFSEGLARVLIEGKWGYINKMDELVIKPTFQLSYDFVNGYAKAKTKNKWGLIDQSGNYIVEPQYYDITDFSGKVYGYQEVLGKPWGIKDMEGNEIQVDTIKRMQNFREVLAPARNTKDLWGFVNEKGEWVIEPQYTGANIFSSGMASVEVDYNKWGFINENGEMVIPPKYDRHAIFRGDWARVEIVNRIYYIDKEGTEVYFYDK